MASTVWYVFHLVLIFLTGRRDSSIFTEEGDYWDWDGPVRDGWLLSFDQVQKPCCNILVLHRW